MTETELNELTNRLEQAETAEEIDLIAAELGVTLDDDAADGRWQVRTLAQVADFFGVHEQTIKQWRSEGMPNDDSSWNLRTISRWRLNKFLRRGGDADESERSLRREKLRVEVERKKLDLQEREGLLVLREAVAVVLREMFTTCRCRLEAIPGEIASSVPPEVRALVVEESTVKVRAALMELGRMGELKARATPEVAFDSEA